jgi:tetratricopeptide (TPR) repeat protein
MCAAMAGDAVPAALAGTLHLRSDGVPLHVEELFAAPGAVPETLADAVRARAGLLSDRARAIAGAAAVLGRRFDVDLLARVTGDPASIDGALRELGERFLVVEADEGLEFRHALIRDAIYADLPPLTRRSLHARSAKAAVAANLGDAAISAHYEQAHQPEPAYRHALAGARKAAAVSAHREAAELYRRAQRTAPAAVPAGQRAGLVAELAAALAAIDANDAAAAAYEEAARRYSELGRITDAAALAPALAAVRHLLGVGLEQRVELLRRALDDVPDENPDVRARILAALAAAYMLDRRLEAAFEAGVEASTLVTDPDQARPECCWSGSFRCRRMLPGP